MNVFSAFDLASIAVAGFSVVSAVLLLLAYALLISVPAKSIYSVAACVVLVASLTAIQAGHLLYFVGGAEPLEQFYYRFALFMAPAAFYSFGRWAILPTELFRPVQLLHLLPVLLLFAVRLEIALPILFLFGVGYSLWLARLVYGLRQQRKQFRFELLYFVVMCILAVIVLGLGFALPYIADDMDTGFRSQSAFYAAFKEVTGQSPGEYRKAQSAATRDS